MKKTLLLWLFGLLLTAQVFAQNRSLSGTVKDATTGEALIGVNVTGKGTTIGTVTDIDGKYTLELPKDVTTLVFSYVGYTNLEKPITALKIDAAMAVEGKVLEELVVTALGVKKEEKALSYAVQKIGGDDINKARETNIVNSLSGKIAGVQVTSSSGAVGASSRLVIRGSNSITGNNQPLYVIDGVPIDNRSFSDAGSTGGFDLPNGIGSINADDVEDIQVLKGPTATAIYGIRAANGVVLITTKKGPKSKEGGPIGVSLNTSLTFEQPLVIPDFQNSYGQGPNKDFFTWGDEGDADGAVDESWGPPLDKGLEFVQWNSYTVGGKPLPWVSRPNNVRSLYRTGITWNNSVAFEGATDKFTYRLSFGNNNQKGMIYNTDFNRYTVAVNASGKLTEKLTSSFSLNYIKEKSGNLPTGGYASENFVQQTIWSGRNVDFNALKDWRNLPIVGAGRPAAGTPYNWNTQFQNNPFWVLDNNLNKYDKNRLIGNIQLNYQIKKYLFVKARTGVDYWSSVITEQKSIGTNESLDGFFRENHRNATEMNSELMIGYDDKFLKDRLGVTLTLAGNLMTERYKRVAVQADALELPGLYTIGNVKSGTTAQTLTEQINSNLYSIYGTGGLSWDGWIYTDFSVRNDWSSRLPKKSNNFLSYSVGGGLVLSELIKKNQDMLNYLKIRGSYSKVGSFGALEPYRTDQTFTIRNLKLGSTILIFDPSTLNNPNLKPESTKSWEVGLEARLIKNRINFDVAYYEKKSSDLLVPVNVSAGTGYTSAWNNVASIKNNGVELQFGAKLLDKADYKIGVNLNWAKNWNKVLSLGGLDSYILGGQWDMTLEARVGQPLGLIVGHDYLRAPDGQIIHKNGLPSPDPTTKVFGSIVPKWTGGVSLDIYVKGVSISTLFDMKWGGLIHSMTYTWGRYAGTLNETLLGRETGIVGVGVKNEGTEDNPVFVPNDVVRSAQDYNHAAFDNSTTVNGTFDASYIKWRQLVVSYNLPKKAFKNTRIEDIGFGVVARNLMILYKKAPHIDPESAFSSANGEQGQEFGQLPSARSIGFNFNIKF